MKPKISKILISTLSLLLLTSCRSIISDEDTIGTDEPDQETVETPVTEEIENELDEEAVSQELADWIPRLDNVVYSYEGTGNEYASYAWNPQFNQANYYQIVTNNGGTVLAEGFEYTDEQITRTFTRSETYFRDNFSEISSVSSESDAEIFLKTPIKVGSSWESSYGAYEITSINKEITVPAGTYQTIEVSITYPDSQSRRYYAKDVGLVYEISQMDSHTIESKLSSILTDTPESLLMTVYVPDAQAMGMDTVNAELVLSTNDPARIAIQELLTGENPTYPEINILPEGTEIQYLFLNNNNIVEVDVSTEFINMNAGSTGELFYLYTLVNTLCNYYGANEVLLTVDGEAYEGAHLLLEEGETLQFNEEMVN